MSSLYLLTPFSTLCQSSSSISRLLTRGQYHLQAQKQPSQQSLVRSSPDVPARILGPGEVVSCHTLPCAAKPLTPILCNVPLRQPFHACSHKATVWAFIRPCDIFSEEVSSPQTKTIPGLGMEGLEPSYFEIIKRWIFRRACNILYLLIHQV